MYWYKKRGSIVQVGLVRSRNPFSQETFHKDAGNDYETVPGTVR